MPIDASIPLRVQVPNLADIYLQRAQLQNAQQRNQMGALQLAAAQQQAKDAADLRGAYASNPSNPVQALQETNPYLAAQEKAKLAAQQQQGAITQAKLTAAQLANTQAQTQGYASLLGGVKDQATFDLANRTALQKGFITPDEYKAIPAYSPQLVDFLRQRALTVNQQATIAHQQAVAEETARHNKQTEEQAAANLENTRNYQAQELNNQRANIGLRRAELNLQRQKFNAESSSSPQIDQIGDAIANGRLTEDMVPGFAKIKPAVQAYLAKKYPDLDQNSVMLNGEERKRRDLALNAIHNVDLIQSIVQRRPDLIGKLQGRISAGATVVGTNDPDLSALATALDNYGLASTGAHGIRAVEARKDAKLALLNGLKNGPQGVSASISAAKGSLQQFADMGKPRRIDGTFYSPNVQSPATVKLRAPNGQIADVPANQVQHYKSLGAVEVK